MVFILWTVSDPKNIVCTLIKHRAIIDMARHFHYVLSQNAALDMTRGDRN